MHGKRLHQGYQRGAGARQVADAEQVAEGTSPTSVVLVVGGWPHRWLWASAGETTQQQVRYCDRVTKTVNRVIESERMVRVLDAAAELLVRLSYRRVTIEDVARAAGVGKGTVYLHFPNKESLFITVLLRAQREGQRDVADRVRADPVEAMPARMMGSAYRRLAEDPVARAVYLGDPETFG